MSASAGQAPTPLLNAAVMAGSRAVRNWLYAVYATILAIVVVGGVTRLTGSGLSMVEWRPLMGTLPPLDAQEWQRVFARYKTSPQYKTVNHWMTLGDFKRIFFWEYFHRLLGRLVGVVFFVPWVYFILRRRIRGKLIVKTGIGLLLGGGQGLLGWFMVKSGLSSEPAVSHYRLAAHLLLAFVVAHYLLWLALDLPADQDRRDRNELPPQRGLSRRLRTVGWLVLALTVVQLFYGALMAGLRAGYLFSTYPDMNGSLAPAAAFAFSPAWRNLFDNPVGVHFIHRTFAVVNALAILAFWWRARRRVNSPAPLRRRLDLLAALVVLQFGLGVATVLSSMNIVIAVLHQAGGFFLISGLVAVLHRPPMLAETASVRSPAKSPAFG